MSFQNHPVLAQSTVATAPSPATSGTSVTVAAGDGTSFGTAPFQVLIWPVGSQPTLANAEIATCTARSTDTLTITRAQEGTSARSVTVGDQIAAVITPKHFTDLESAFTGDSGSGGSKGLVPAPASGDAAAGKFLKADGTWAAPSGGGGGSVTPSYVLFAGFESGSSSSALNARYTTATGGTGSSINGGSTGVNLNLGTSAGDFAQAYLRDQTAGDSFDGNVNFGCGYSSFQGVTNSQELFVGIGLLTVAGSGITMTGKHIGFYSAYTGSANVNKYTCADGTTQNSGTFTGTGSNDRAFLVKSGTSSIKYYYNGVLKGTLTANIPTGSASTAPIFVAATSLGSNSNGYAQVFWALYTKEAF